MLKAIRIVVSFSPPGARQKRGRRRVKCTFVVYFCVFNSIQSFVVEICIGSTSEKGLGLHNVCSRQGFSSHSGKTGKKDFYFNRRKNQGFRWKSKMSGKSQKIIKFEG